MYKVPSKLVNGGKISRNPRFPSKTSPSDGTQMEIFQISKGDGTDRVLVSGVLEKEKKAHQQ